MSDDQEDLFDVTVASSDGPPPASDAPRTMPVRTRESSLPEPLGPYLLKRRIGAGGMAEVFLAEKEGPGGFTKTVVIKRILPHLAENERFVEMFLREAHVAARLNHTNVVQIYELGEVKGQYFLAMEHVDGVTLHRLARRAWRHHRSVPMEVVVHAVADAALGLHHAHELGLVHRDVSPDNLIITRAGVTKVLDFGIAKGAETRQVTKTGELKGKAPYMAPEQVRGDDLDGRADLYALGVTLYWLLTGKKPFEGNSDFMILQAVLSDPAPSPREHNPGIPKQLERIVLQLLEKDPQRRMKSGAELHDALVGLIPARTTETTAFISEVMGLTDDKRDEPITFSEQFPASAPITGELLASSRAPPVAPARNQRATLAAIAGGLAAVVLAAGALLALLPGDEPTSPGADALVVTKVAPVTTAPEDEAAAPASEPAAAAASAPEPPAAEPPPAEASLPERTEPASTAQVAAASPRADKRRATRAKTRVVTARAPSSVRWELDGRTVGRGNARLSLPIGARRVTAVDTRRGGRTVVEVAGGSVDYARLPKGKLALYVYPYAKVSLGSEVLGTTPFAPIALTAGSYVVELEHEGRRVKRKVTVEAGKVSRLKVDLTP